jgi:hypothetical protein
MGNSINTTQDAAACADKRKAEDDCSGGSPTKQLRTQEKIEHRLLTPDRKQFDPDDVVRTKVCAYGAAQLSAINEWSSV